MRTTEVASSSRIKLALLVIAVLVFPFLAAPFGNAWVRIADVALLYIMLALGLNIVVGFAGLLDLGYVAFFAIGAYLAGLLSSPQLVATIESLQIDYPALATWVTDFVGPAIATQGIHLSVWLIIPLAAAVAGIAGAGGNGKVMAEWIVNGEPPMDLWKMDSRRFGPQYKSRGFSLARTDEVYSTYYDIAYPNHERLAGRPLRVPPAYERHRALDAEFGEKSGWERVNWYSSNEDPAHEHQRPRGWAGQHWSTAIVTEHLATRSTAGLFDESSFAKIEISGPRALEFLQKLCTNSIDKATGSITYTQMLNSRAGIECDFTITRLASDRFLIVTGTAFGRHDMSWISSHAPTDGSVTIRDVTSSLACFGLWGPNARSIVESVSADDLSFGFMQARQITIGEVPCWALRVTYVGESGWELYPAAEFGLRLWDTLVHAGAPFGLVPGGYRAIDSLRLEKGYRAWGSDITNDTDPYSSGLGFAVRLDHEFIGRDALPDPSTGGEQRLCCLVLADSQSVAMGNEPVSLPTGEIVGRVTSGGQGYSLGVSIAYAWLPRELAEPGTAVSVEVFGVAVAAEVRADPLFDPTGARVRA